MEDNRAQAVQGQARVSPSRGASAQVLSHVTVLAALAGVVRRVSEIGCGEATKTMLRIQNLAYSAVDDDRHYII